MSNQYSNFKTVRSGPPKKKSILPWALGCFGGFILIAFLAVVAYFVFSSSSNETSSTILIREPLEDASFRMGTPVTLRAVAQGKDNINQIELWVDEQLINFEKSNVTGGISPFPIIATWYPTSVGTHTISARSTDGNGNQSVDQITVTIEDDTDRDGDFIPDDVDDCPDQPGTEAAMGCMDRDYDGTPDDQDACPDTAGVGEDGCPAPAENDRDGDGMVDEADSCPDESGSPLADGCPDRDGDGFADAADACPDEAGVAEGCPTPGDMDSDGVPDDEDVSPTLPGDPELAGGADSDGDGVLDGLDACPDTPGSAANNGCPDMDGAIPPPPEADDEDSDEPFFSGLLMYAFLFEFNPPIPLEINAYDLTINGDYEHVWCYLQLDDGPFRRYDIEPSGENHWNVAEALGGENSIHISHEDGDTPVVGRIRCLGRSNSSIISEISNESFTHPPEVWDGRTLGLSTISNDFLINYQICRNSCDESELQTPILSPISTGLNNEGPFYLHWSWGGRSENIDGFKIRHYRDGGLYNIITVGSMTRIINLERYISACGHNDEFKVYAYKSGPFGIIIKSPPSNIVGRTSGECKYVAEVYLNYMDIHNPQHDENNIAYMGPVYGGMYVDSDNSIINGGYEAWNFSTFWHSWLGSRIDGLWLHPGVTTFEDLIEWIVREKSSCYGSLCHSNDYSVPDSQSIFFELEEGQDFVVGGNIREADRGLNAPDDLYKGKTTIHFDDLILDQPVQYVLESDVMNVVVDITLRRSP